MPLSHNPRTGQEYKFKPGDLFRVNAQIPHAYLHFGKIKITSKDIGMVIQIVNIPAMNWLGRNYYDALINEEISDISEEYMSPL